MIIPIKINRLMHMLHLALWKVATLFFLQVLHDVTLRQGWAVSQIHVSKIQLLYRDIYIFRKCHETCGGGSDYFRPETNYRILFTGCIRVITMQFFLFRNSVSRSRKYESILLARNLSRIIKPALNSSTRE